MKTLTLALTALLAFAPSALADHTEPDGDIIPEDVEHRCGTGIIQMVVNMLPEEYAHCGEGDDMQAGIIGAPAPCATCTETNLLPPTPLALFPGAPPQPVAIPAEDVPGQGSPIGTIEGHLDDEMEHYCVTFTPTDGDPFPVCIDAEDANPLLPPIPPTPIGQTPEIPACSIVCEMTPAIPAVAVQLRVYYLHDDARLHDRASAGPIHVYEPVDLGEDAEVAWWTENAEGTSLVVEFVPILDGVPQGTGAVHVPLAGQLIAAQQATIKTLPL